MAYKKLKNRENFNDELHGVQFINSEAQDFLTNADITYIEEFMGEELEDVDGSPADIEYVLTTPNVTDTIFGVQFINSVAVGNLSQAFIAKMKGMTGMEVVVNTAAEIQDTAFDAMMVGRAFEQTIHATGGNQPLTFSALNLPAGLTIETTSPDCVISGTPTTAGEYAASLICRDSSDDTDRVEYTGTVAENLTITSETFAKGMDNKVYDEPVVISGGTEPYTVEVSDGELPAGLTISGSDIQGTPTTVETGEFTLKVTDANGFEATKNCSLQIIQELLFMSTTLNKGIVGGAYSKQLEAEGGQGPYTWSIETGELPDGLTLDANTGLISGTPTEAFDDVLTIRVQDSSPTPFVTDKEFDLEIYGKIQISFAEGSVVEGVCVLPYAINDVPIEDVREKLSQESVATITGGVAPYTAVIDDAQIATDLSLDWNEVSEVMDVTGGCNFGAGTHIFTITITDSAAIPNEKTILCSLQVNPQFYNVGTVPPSGTEGADYSFEFQFAGGFNNEGFESGTVLEGDSFPAGLALLGRGIEGQPTTAGTYSFRIVFADSICEDVQVAVKMTIAEGE